MSLLIKRCSYKAAKFAVINWHYSKTMPNGKLVKFGVWENDKFIGVVLYGKGANNMMPKHYNLKHTELCELVRVALTKHKTETTRIIAITLKLLKKENPGLKLVFSYADKTNQGHEGIIYKAGNWQSEGLTISKGDHLYLDNKIVHGRSINKKIGSHKKAFEYYGTRLKYAEPQKKYRFSYAL